jgi:ribosomal protein S24E
LDLKILTERPNPLLQRVEYTFEIDHATASTPPRGEVRSELAKLLKVPADRLVIERMNARFGTAKTRGEAMAYQTADALRVTVREHILIRNGLKEKERPAAPAASSPTPAPSEAAKAPSETGAQPAPAGPPSEKK